MPACVFTIAATIIALLPSEALASGAPLVSETFANNSTPVGQWYLPPAQSGTNGACVTAGPVSSSTSIPTCASPPDTSGNGALRLTNNSGNQVGAVFYEASLPTSQGLDLTLDTYQYDGTGADGIVFALAAVNPSSPTPPLVTGPLGGDLGYAANTTGSPGAAGLPFGYLGIGLDVYGNFENTPLAGGSGCTIPSPLVSGKAYPESVTARGPGNGTAGYCILGTTATTYNKSSGGGSGGGTISNLGSGHTLDSQKGTSRSGVVVPVELAINPSASVTNTARGLSVPANSWIIAYTPLGTATQQTLTGALPTTTNNAALASFPASWINPATGIPYQLMFGFTASTGGSNEFHDVNHLTASSLLGSVPVLSLSMSDNENAAMLAGNRATFVLAPSVAPSGGAEAATLTVTDTLPAGITPGTATSGSDWLCATAGQTVTCRYTPLAPVAAGTALPDISIPVALSSGSTGTVTNTARISSIDGLPAVSGDQVVVTSFTASAAPSPQMYSQPVTYAAALPASATGTVTFTTGTTVLCVATLPAWNCGASSAPIGSDPVTATYSGDTNFAPQITTTTVTIIKATPALSEAAAPATIAYGAQDTLAVFGLPGGATGTVTFASGSTPLCIATLPVTSCQTPTTLAAGTYLVTATYSGDSNDTVASATGASFRVTKATTSMTESAAPASIAYGAQDTLAVSGLPVGAAGTVTFTSGGTTLCSATLPAVSCQTSSALAAGSYPVTATYSGDTNYIGTTATGASFTVTRATTSFTEWAAPASVPYGNADTLSVAGLPGGATGTLRFAWGSTTLCSATLPVVNCQTSTTLSPSTYPVTATYSGDSNHSSATTTGASFTVTKADTTMSESASPPSIGYGSHDTLSVAGLPAGATGAIAFTSGSTTLCTATLPATSCQTSPTLEAGTYPVTSAYSGDSDYNATTAAGASFRVTRANTTFTESAAPASIPYGTADTLSITGLAGDATGTVTFTAGSTILCAAVLPVTGCQTSPTLTPGTYPVTATYPGDGNYNGATATGASFTVNKANPTFTESAAPASVPFGSADTLSVSGLPGDATGTVMFTSGSTGLCTTTLPAMSCQTSSTLPPNTYPVTATYAGDSNYNGAPATGATFTVTQASTSMTESAAPASVAYGAQDTLSVTGLPGDATGTVTFAWGGTTLCAATLPALSCPTSTSLAPGVYAVTATYSGDSNYTAASATGATFTVTRASTTMTESAAPATIAYGTQDTLSVSGLPGDASGTVTFASGSFTLCTAVLPAASCQTATSLAPATYPATATYSGDGHYGGTTASGAGFTVTKANSAMTESASPVTIVFGSTDLLSVSTLPAGATGMVTFTSGSTALCTTTLPATSCRTGATLTPATYAVTASYSGDVNNSAATATGARFTVIKAETSMTVIASPSQTIVGVPVTLSMSGLPPGSSGTVTVMSGNVVLCTATLPSTSCTTTADLPPGMHPIQATYSGDADYNGSTAVGRDGDGVLSVIAPVPTPATGAGPEGPRAFLSAGLLVLGTCALVVSRGRSTSSPTR